MSAISKMMIIVLMLGFSASLPAALDPTKADLTKQSGVGAKQAPMKMHEMKMNDQLANKRFPIKEWHAEFSPIGTRRSRIDVRESQDKKRFQPNIIEMERKERKMAPMNGRKAYLRNFTRVREKQLVPAYRDAEVVSVQGASVPAPSNATKEEKEVSMRDINRFTFQRNHSDSSGVKVDRAGSGQKE